MAADEKKFASFDVFLAFYEQKVQDYTCIVGGEDADKLKKAALSLIQGLRAGIPLPGSSEATSLGIFYNNMRAELGLSAKNLKAHVAKSPDHYHLALIARDMFDAILNSEVKLGVVTKKALESHKHFLQKRRNEIDSLIKNYEAGRNFQGEFIEELYHNSSLILEPNRDRANAGTDPIKSSYVIKQGMTIKDLREFVAKTEELVERTLLLADRRPLISQGQCYSAKKGYQTTPRAKLLTAIFLPEKISSGVIISPNNPFYQFRMAIENLESNEELGLLVKRMDDLEAKCHAEAPMASTRAQFCDAYAANAESGKEGGLFLSHQSIQENLRMTLEKYEDSRSSFFAFKRPEKVQKIMSQLKKEIYKEIEEDCREIASHYYSSEQLVAIIHHFKEYEQTLEKMKRDLVGEFKTLAKAEKEEEYKIISDLHVEIIKFNAAVEKEICAEFRDKIAGLANIEPMELAPLAQRKLIIKK